MNIRSGRTASKRGFTLIEVLIALVIFAVGMLALQALGIYAVRAVGQADRNSRSAAVATLYLEDALQQIRTNRIPGSCTDKMLPNGDVVSRSVIVGPSSTTPSRVSVTVTPASRGRVEQPYTITGYGYTPAIPTASGNACP